MKNGVDTDRYSRQIGTMGMTAMERLIKLKVLIVGMRGLGAEIAKNIILSGVNSVYIYDPTITKVNDLSSNFCLSEEDIDKKFRDEASIKKLSELNPMVKVSTLRFEQDKNFTNFVYFLCQNINQFDIVIYTEFRSFMELNYVNTACRMNMNNNKKMVKFIYALSLGLTGYILTDFGDDHEILMEAPKIFNIKNITKGKNGIVTIDSEKGDNNLDIVDGSFVTFSDIEGMTELNQKSIQMKAIDFETFQILEDTSKYNDYIRGGKVSKTIKNYHKKYWNFNDRTICIKNSLQPGWIFDAEKVGRGELLYMILMALQDFYISHNFQLPELNNLTQAKEIEKNVKQFYDVAKEKKLPSFQGIQEYDEKIVINVIRWAKAQICPIAAFFGGIVAHEVLKATGKNEPINQWLIMDFFESVQNIKEDADRTLKGTRYDDQIAIFGNEIQKKLEKTNFFMVGAGATGCEFLKNFAMMGTCSEKNYKFIVTDNDNIEISNLSRQFLFKKDDVGKSKSEVAKNSVKIMNPGFNVESRQDLVSSETENIFNEDFWERNDFIIYAVDSIGARKYIDTKAIMFEKCAIDSGTKGVEARSQIIVPFETNTYSDEAPQTETKELPMCTLRLFPSKFEHCVEWAKDYFSEYFVLIISDTKRFFEDKKSFIESFKTDPNLERLRSIESHIDFVVNKNLEKLIEYAMTIYTNSFDYNIRSLLISFPEDYKRKEDGKPFWGSSKIRPHELPFDSNNPQCINYIKVFIKILSHSLGLEFQSNELSDENIKNICAKIQLPEFKVKKIDENVIDQDSNDNPQDENENQEENQKISDEIIKKIDQILDKLEKIDEKKFDFNKINPEKFEKDHDENGHIDFIHFSSCLRAKNYDITPCERNTTKIISGKIIPTILTSTASIAGIASLQIYTLLQTHDIKYIRKCFFNLGRLEFILDNPHRPIYKKDKLVKNQFNDDSIEVCGISTKVIPENSSCWDKIIIKGSKTCEEIMDFLKEKYNIDVDILASGEITLINTMFPSSNKFLGRKLEDIYNEKQNLN